MNSVYRVVSNEYFETYDRIRPRVQSRVVECVRASVAASQLDNADETEDLVLSAFHPSSRNFNIDPGELLWE